MFILKLLQKLTFFLLILLIGCKKETPKQAEKVTEAKPTVSFTFDDGITSDLAGYDFKEWNQMILSHLDKENLKAVFFVTGKNKQDEKGQFLLNSWNTAGHRIANHSFTHPNFNSDEHTAQRFEKELKRTDSVISNLSNSIKLFRFPYLKEGQNPLKVDSIRNILTKNHYANGYVTIDASDWYVNSRLLKRIKEVGIEKTDINQFKDFYVQHILERANYYETLSNELNGRNINHTLLLHHNLTSALFLDDLINKFKEEGWHIIDAEQAYQDSVFTNIPTSKFAGESLTWSLAKESGNYEKSLRYPAEDSRYEKEKMDTLGL
ncbi:polysaccharide deacetylase family protein [Aureibaculum sp. A20]|uniref:Polysaccharide deacetylase family protein n=1 Tax=Aureibaculum flavum TaxID=2795986 RepID=A0ABS0WV60_9FLAO|nr:polysaccharide deacetylase family protein [Aureibaculum flavum]MBJ2175869.1 polysaccharide deacetylase family protein [Aureibaculum flavum]